MNSDEAINEFEERVMQAAILAKKAGVKLKEPSFSMKGPEGRHKSDISVVLTDIPFTIYSDETRGVDAKELANIIIRFSNKCNGGSISEIN
jgi:hypothetical protein